MASAHGALRAPRSLGGLNLVADRFYTPDPLPPGEYVLAGPDAHHAAVVRRFQPGDTVTLFNGDNHDYPATIVAGDRRRLVLIVEPGVAANRERQIPIWLASAIPKGDRADFLIEKLTELGVVRFTPLVCDRSVVVPKPAAVEKFRRQVIEASKQCGRNRLMRVDDGQRLTEFLALAELPPERLLLHPSGELPLTVAGAARTVLIGPEGGFTSAEVAQATESGWQAVTVGPRVLRVETAAIVAAV